MRWAREDLERDDDDPLFTAKDIARLTGWTIGHTNRVLAETDLREIGESSGGRPARVVRYSRLVRLLEEWREHYDWVER